MRPGKRRIQVGASLRRTAGLMLVPAFCAAVLGACASVDSPYGDAYDETDIWDSSVVYLRHVDVFQLADANGAVLWEGTLPETDDALLETLKQYGGD